MQFLIVFALQHTAVEVGAEKIRCYVAGKRSSERTYIHHICILIPIFFSFVFFLFSKMLQLMIVAI